MKRGRRWREGDAGQWQWWITGTKRGAVLENWVGMSCFHRPRFARGVHGVRVFHYSKLEFLHSARESWLSSPVLHTQEHWPSWKGPSGPNAFFYSYFGVFPPFLSWTGLSSFHILKIRADHHPITPCHLRCTLKQARGVGCDVTLNMATFKCRDREGGKGKRLWFSIHLWHP